MKKTNDIINNNLTTAVKLVAAVKEVNRVYISRDEIQTAICGEINWLINHTDVADIVTTIRYGSMRAGSVSPKHFKKFVGRDVSEWDNLIATDRVCRDFKFEQDGCTFTVTDIRKTGVSNLNFSYTISLQEENEEEA